MIDSCTPSTEAQLWCARLSYGPRGRSRPDWGNGPRCRSRLSTARIQTLDPPRWMRSARGSDNHTSYLHRFSAFFFLCLFLIWVCVSVYRIARVVHEVDLGKSHMYDQCFHAHNATLIAVLILGNNGDFGFSWTLRTGRRSFINKTPPWEEA